ncbi:MAG: chemotaxis protein CheC [Dehalococcoidales bacterium]
MRQIEMLTKDEVAIWTWLVSKGIANALSGLSEMVGQKFSLTSLGIRQLPAKKAATLLGEPENEVVGICQEIRGDATGYLILIHEPQIAFELVDIQMGLPFGSTQYLKGIERSTLEEIGNVTGSFFLNSLADSTGLSFLPSPPIVMTDMAGAILDITLSQIMQEQDNVLCIKTTFGTAGRQMQGVFLVMPTLDFLGVLLQQYKKDDFGL